MRESRKFRQGVKVQSFGNAFANHQLILEENGSVPVNKVDHHINAIYLRFACGPMAAWYWMQTG